MPFLQNYFMRKILVADDYQPLRLSLEKTISSYLGERKNGYWLFSAEDGKKALELYGKEKPFHAAFIDNRMPGLCGTKLAEILHKDDPDLRICIISTMAPAEMQEYQECIPFADFVSKPPDKERLFYVFKKYFVEE
jgi:CheY-like chemotaxis protein